MKDYLKYRLGNETTWRIHAMDFFSLNSTLKWVAYSKFLKMLKFKVDFIETQNFPRLIH